ncbi:hypothetical protein [Acidisphaera sp. L21]|uniref:hypothetical protein n=1 Tax=Acidisphaera sp. L21 TaxID=1641851 RepID=UPI00131CA72E|nr:hypothetical protein [Acidisphaera sp. L21]
MTTHADPAGHPLGARVHPDTHDMLHRDARAQVFKDKGAAVVAEVPGWYLDNDGQPIITPDDDKVKVRAVAALNALKRGFDPAGT